MARRRKSIPVQSAVVTDEVFERELEIFRIESETALQFFYGYLTIHAAAGADRKIHARLNTAPLFWNTILGALQTAAFIALGRVLDGDSTHNMWTLLRMAEDNQHLFSKGSLASRKQGTAANPPAWLTSYLKDVYVPKGADFQRLRGYASRQRKIYLQKYQPLRHKVFAHKGTSGGAQVSAMFANTNIRELQRMLLFLISLHDALWGLFMNGRKPVLRPRKLSVNLMLAAKAAPGRSSEVHVRLVQEAKRYLEAG